MIAPLCGSFGISHIGYASAFGFFSGGYIALTAIVLVDIVGIEKLSDAFGVILLFMGIAAAIGSPITGEYWISNLRSSFFYICLNMFYFQEQCETHLNILLVPFSGLI